MCRRVVVVTRPTRALRNPGGPSGVASSRPAGWPGAWLSCAWGEREEPPVAPVVGGEDVKVLEAVTDSG